MITFISPDLTKPIGSDVVLECEAIGFERPDGIVWTTNSPLYTTSDLRSFTVEDQIDDITVHSNLTLPSVVLDSHGAYTCTATNSQGFDRATSVLFISSMYVEGKLLFWNNLFYICPLCFSSCSIYNQHKSYKIYSSWTNCNTGV